MPIPRKLIVDNEQSGVYHCIARCVRRAFLCGLDPLTGNSYEHRKAWVQYRIFELAEIFSITVYSYAVMSNHVHLVLQTNPDISNAWSDTE
ncbi:MAG: transposase, partial [Proteobacteria bacterium]|nr:transposase [Pseudomonadota bacterium]